MSTPALPVLFVDDETGNLELFKMQFEDTFAVRTAVGGDEALAIMGRELVGMLLTDERMPGMTGVDLLARAVARWPDTVRVIVSAYSDSPRLLQAINRGHAHEYIVKPWDRGELRDDLERARSTRPRGAARRRTQRIDRVFDRVARSPAERGPLRALGDLGGHLLDARAVDPLTHGCCHDRALVLRQFTAVMSALC